MGVILSFLVIFCWAWDFKVFESVVVRFFVRVGFELFEGVEWGVVNGALRFFLFLILKSATNTFKSLRSVTTKIKGRSKYWKFKSYTGILKKIRAIEKIKMKVGEIAKVQLHLLKAPAITKITSTLKVIVILILKSTPRKPKNRLDLQKMKNLDLKKS